MEPTLTKAAAFFILIACQTHPANPLPPPSPPYLIEQVGSRQSTTPAVLISADLWPIGHWRLIAIWLEGHLSATLAKLSLASGGRKRFRSHVTN